MRKWVVKSFGEPKDAWALQDDAESLEPGPGPIATHNVYVSGDLAFLPHRVLENLNTKKVALKIDPKGLQTIRLPPYRHLRT